MLSSAVNCTWLRQTTLWETVHSGAGTAGMEGAALLFVVWIDHKHLAYLRSAKRSNSRQAGWELFLIPFTLTLLPGVLEREPPRRVLSLILSFFYPLRGVGDGYLLRAHGSLSPSPALFKTPAPVPRRWIVSLTWSLTLFAAPLVEISHSFLLGFPFLLRGSPLPFAWTTPFVDCDWTIRRV